MNLFIAALPMYDWSETYTQSIHEWHQWRDYLRVLGVQAPEKLARRNGEMFELEWGIPNNSNNTIAFQFSHRFDLATLWCHKDLLFSQTCWGPLNHGLLEHVHIIGQPSYDAYEGGKGAYYRSAIVMREGDACPVPNDGCFALPLKQMRGKSFAANGPDSLSGFIALQEDLHQSADIASNQTLDHFFKSITLTGSHRDSVRAVAHGKCDVAAIDCRTLDLCHRFEPAMRALKIVGWTAQRLGLPYICAPRFAHLYDPINLASRGYVESCS